MKKMKIAVPSNTPGGLAGKRSDHFGHCDLFTLVEINDGKIVGVDTLGNVEHGAGGCMTPVALLKERGVDSVVVAGMGARPLKGFAEAGIEVFFAAMHLFDKVEDVVRGVMENRLQLMQASDACQGHGSCHG
jgi:predicted Fe-Mo cluster-binding NifX family protein